MRRFFQKFTLYELVVTAVMAALGIAIKPIVVPLAHIICGPLMIPSGALAGGLYMMWLVIGYGMIKKPGSAMIISTIQALLVIFTGVVGSHGIMSLLTYILPGLAVELVMIISRHRAEGLGSCVAAGIFSNLVGTATVNIIFFRAPGIYLILILSLSAISGLAGGALAMQLIKIIGRFSKKRESTVASHKWMEDIDSVMTDDLDNSSLVESLANAEKTNKTGNRKTWKWILALAIVLALVIGITGWLNHDGNDSEEGKISVLVEGETKASFTMSEVMKMKSKSVHANLSSTSKEDAVGDFKGVLIKTLLEEAGVDVKGHSAVIITSSDGYSSAADTDETEEVLIAYEQDGDTLGYYTKGGTGPFRALFFKDTYGNRSVMNAVKVDLR